MTRPFLRIRTVTVAVAAILVLIFTKAGSAQQSPAIEITSPPNGSVVAPGDTIVVIVTPAPGVNFMQVIIIGEDPIGFSEVKTAPPFEFSLAIPADIRLGAYQLTASGATGPGTGAESSPVTLNVERTGTMSQLSVKPTQIHFGFAGEQMPLRVIGTFADGTADITESAQTIYTSNNLDVATVNETGVVTAVGPVPQGATEITTQITVTHSNKSAVVPVTFRPVDNVSIDIKPGTYPNSINLGSSGTVPVAILSDPSFDATTVDPITVTLASAPVGLKGKGTPQASSEDVNGDGRLDLVVHVETEALQLSPTSTKAVLEGKTFAGDQVRGSDFVNIVP